MLTRPVGIVNSECEPIKNGFWGSCGCITNRLSEVGVLGVCLLSDRVLNVWSTSSAAHGEAGSWGCPLDGMALCWV